MTASCVREGFGMGRERAPAGGTLNQRQLRVGERLRHVLADLFSKGAVHDPVIAERPLTISEVRITRDLRQATVYVVELGGELSPEMQAALVRATPFIRGEVARQSNLKYAPNLTFRADETFAESARIDALLDEARQSRPARGGSDDGEHDEGGHG
ncbi:MAG: 30S ribosome-binding factor RbfA [Geminicoccaceae bacterium]